MRLLLTLHTDKNNSVIPINYQYPLSSALYHIIAKGHAGYASFLHETGYGKGFKSFTFSDIKYSFKIDGVSIRDKRDLKDEFYESRIFSMFILEYFMKNTNSCVFG